MKIMKLQSVVNNFTCVHRRRKRDHCWIPVTPKCMRTTIFDTKEYSPPNSPWEPARHNYSDGANASDSLKNITWPVSQPSAPWFPIAQFHNMTHLFFSVATPGAPVNAAIHYRSNSFWTLRRRIVSRWLHNGPELFWISQENHFGLPSSFFPCVAFHEPCAR